ncbi:PilN domain-containing protein [Solibacillus isronensis]|uniref:PilN domain-containing protein n=1 Tax=Solibacillus isronensis TaxID=412383 RepID=UPI0009A5F4D0|nr:PilN domain-containing protein [Solibacillus isronensis]
MIPDINLLPKIEKGATSLKLAFILVGILSILTIGLLAITYFSAKSEIASAVPERDSLLVTRDTLNAEVASSQTGSKGSLEESVAFVERVSYRVSPIIIETRNLLPTDTYLRSYGFSETGVQVAVDFETLNAISTYVSQLEKSPYFSDVQVGTIQNFELNPTDEEINDTQQFTEVPRYSVEIFLVIDQLHVAAGGEE